MVRPVELADFLSKAEVIGKLKQIQKANSEMEQRQASSILKEKKTTDPERTHEPEKSDLLIITRDEQKEKEKKGYKKGKEDNGNDNQDESESQQPDHLDLKA
jgi:hypothetical protein